MESGEAKELKALNCPFCKTQPYVWLRASRDAWCACQAGGCCIVYIPIRLSVWNRRADNQAVNEALERIAKRFDRMMDHGAAAIVRAGKAGV